MNKPFRFRYANEVAGGFVLLSILLMVGGVFLAGKSKGWFEGKFELHTSFDIKQGSHGLREGNEVVILDTPAGRVGKVVPDEDGSIRADFIINNRFRQYVRKDSVAKVRKKFVATGDAFVQIEVGSGAPVQDGDYIKCIKDEEIMESVQASLKKVEEVFVPMLEEVQEILENINGIVGSIEKGKGTMGAMVNDEQLAADFKGAVTNASNLLAEMQETFSEATVFMESTRGTVSNASEMIRAAEGTFEEATDLFSNAQETVGETTRLIRGAQKTWLFKKHIKQEEKTEFLPMISYTKSEAAALKAEYLEQLSDARMADDSTGIIRAAYNMSVLNASRGDYTTAERFVVEVRSASGKESAFCSDLLSAYLSGSKGDPENALNILKSLSSSAKKHGDFLRIQTHLLAADLYSRMNMPVKARKDLKTVKNAVKKSSNPILKAVDALIYGRVNMMEVRPASAAKEYDRASDEFKVAGSFERMAESLRNAGLAYDQAGDHATAGNRCYRAGRSYFYTGHTDLAKATLLMAERFAVKSSDGDLAVQVKQFVNHISKSTDDS